MSKIDIICALAVRCQPERMMKTMNVSLTPELETLVNQKIASGFYNSASEVVREALRLMQEQDELKRMRLEELRAEIKKGMDSLDRGDKKPLDMNAIKARARQRLTAK